MSDYFALSSGQKCYACGQPATYGRHMTTPNGSVYTRGWCAAHGPLGTAEHAPRAKPQAVPSSDRLQAGHEVDVRIRGRVLRAWPDRVEILLGSGEGRLVAVVPRALLAGPPSNDLLLHGPCLHEEGDRVCTGHRGHSGDHTHEDALDVQPAPVP